MVIGSTKPKGIGVTQIEFVHLHITGFCKFKKCNSHSQNLYFSDSQLWFWHTPKMSSYFGPWHNILRIFFFKLTLLDVQKEIWPVMHCGGMRGRLSQNGSVAFKNVGKQLPFHPGHCWNVGIEKPSKDICSRIKMFSKLFLMSRQYFHKLQHSQNGIFTIHLASSLSHLRENPFFIYLSGDSLCRCKYISFNSYFLVKHRSSHWVVQVDELTSYSRQRQQVRMRNSICRNPKHKGLQVCCLTKPPLNIVVLELIWNLALMNETCCLS